MRIHIRLKASENSFAATTMNGGLRSILWLLFTFYSTSSAHTCSPESGLVHVNWEHKREVQYQLDCNTWAYFCEDSGWGDKEATVLCRGQGYSYGRSDFVSIGGVYELIDSIECEGGEGRLQDCNIQRASNSSSHSVCNLIGAVKCHHNLPQVYISATSDSVPENDSFLVCAHVNGSLSSDITVSLQTFDITALAGFDYVPVGQELEFVASGAQVGCVSVHTLADSLAEGKEWFGIQLSVEPRSLVHLITEKLKLTIEPSDGITVCTEGSVTVVSDADNSSHLQLVEMCSSEGVWSPVCDTSWTAQDATVICRELGYKDLGSIEHHMMGASPAKSTTIFPQCNGDETQLLQCMKKSEESVKCHHVLVNCSYKNSSNEHTSATQRPSDDRDKDDDGDRTIEREGNPEEESFYVVAILGLIAVTLAMAVLMLVLGISVGRRVQQRKRKRRVVHQTRYPGRRSPGTSSHSQSIVENSLYHTTPPNDSTGHIYSLVDNPPPQHHEYATLEEAYPSPTPPQEHNNLYHVLESPYVHQ